MNREMEVYRLTFTAPLHVDGRGTGFYQSSETFIHSDTLSAALLSVWAKLQPDDLKPWSVQPFRLPFLLSSAFPYFLDPHCPETPLYFLPRPLSSRAVRLDKEHLVRNKKIKKIKWLELKIWQKVMAEQWNWQSAKDALMLPQGLLVENTPINSQRFPRAEQFQLWKEETRTRVSLDRVTNRAMDGQLFDFSRVHYHPQSGLYFLAKFANHRIKTSFEGVLSWLGESGIGSDRSCGQGSFTWQGGKLKLPHALPHQPAMALSLVIPSEEDWKQREAWLKHSAYEFIKRGGWIAETSQRKQAVRMFSEGSCFARPLAGQIVTLGQHPHGYPIFRDGRGFFLSEDAPHLFH